MVRRPRPQRSSLHIYTPEEVLEAMKVTMQKLAAGPQGIARKGTVLEVKEDVGKDLIERQIARAYDAQRDAKNRKGWVKAQDSRE